jgi:hypothetical protein
LPRIPEIFYEVLESVGFHIVHGKLVKGILMMMVRVLLVEGGWGGGMILDFIDVFGRFAGWHYFYIGGVLSTMGFLWLTKYRQD